LFVVLVSYFVSSTRLYWICAGWLRLAVNSGTWILGIENRIQGMENLPTGTKDPAVLLVKHQSTWETFVMPAIMPHPLAYVFKKELLRVPFFGWAMSRLDMIAPQIVTTGWADQRKYEKETKFGFNTLYRVPTMANVPPNQVNMTGTYGAAEQGAERNACEEASAVHMVSPGFLPGPCRSRSRFWRAIWLLCGVIKPFSSPLSSEKVKRAAYAFLFQESGPVPVKAKEYCVRICCARRILQPIAAATRSTTKSMA
jgi:hypothetical protein